MLFLYFYTEDDFARREIRDVESNVIHKECVETQCLKSLR
jgi:hypothetical protein